jgi:hypothetical protein
MLVSAGTLAEYDQPPFEVATVVGAAGALLLGAALEELEELAAELLAEPEALLEAVPVAPAPAGPSTAGF